MIAPKKSSEAFSGLKKTCSVGFPPVPADWDCSDKASKIRELQFELHVFCVGRGFVTLRKGYNKALGKGEKSSSEEWKNL